MSYVPFGKFVLLPRLCLLLAGRITMDLFKCVMGARLGQTGVSTVSRSYPQLAVTYNRAKFRDGANVFK
jgi:hypothetical protein